MVNRPVGAVRASDKEIVIDYLVDVAIHADGDLLAQPMRLTGAAFGDHYGGMTTLMSITVIDYDAQGAQGVEIVVVFHNEDPVNCGVLNAAPVLSATKAGSCEGTVTLDTYEDIGAQHIWSEDSIGKTMKADANGDLWAWLIAGGTPTFAGAKLKIKFGFLRS